MGSLFLAIWAVVFAGIPSDAAILGGRDGIDAASNVTSGFLVGVNGHFNDLDRQFSALRSSSQLCTNIDLIPMLSFRAKCGRDIKMNASPTNSSSLQLTAGPAIVSDIARAELDGIEDVSSVEINNSSFSAQALAKEDASSNLSTVGGSNLGSTLSANPVPMTFQIFGPHASDALQIKGSMFSSSGGVEGVSSQIRVVPNDSASVRPSSVSDTGKYELVSDCRNLAVRVVWRSSIVVYSQTVGGHYSLIFREVEDHNRPRNDLGVCSISHKHQKYKKTFSHVALSSGAASLLGFRFDASDEKAPTCLGCTLLVSRDGHHWYEIVAVQ